jgi:nucleotide-binding universal stress UspA family protein
MQKFGEDGGTILLATDFSQPAKRAFDAAVRMAKLLGSSLHILHVNEEENLFAGHSSTELADFMTDIVKKRVQWIDSFVDLATDNGVEAKALLKDGIPSSVISETANELDARVIVVGTLGTTGAKAVLTGSTTRKLMRKAHRPILVVSHDAGVAPLHAPFPTFLHILYPTDLKPSSTQGLHVAETLAKRADAKVTIAHVLKLPTAIPSLPGEAPWSLPARTVENMQERLSAQVADACEKLDANAQSRTTIASRVADGIAEIAKAEEVDLIVMQRHSTHGIKSFFLGQTAEALCNSAPVPVLVFAPES